MSNNPEQGAAYKEASRATFLNFLSELCNYGIIVATAVVTMSISIFMDLINSTCNFLRASICAFLAKRLQKNQSYKYNYGTENLEAIAMLLCEMLLCLGTAAVMVFAVVRLFNPTQPDENMLFAVIVKAINSAVDMSLLVISYKAYKKSKTKVARTNYYGTIGFTCFDVAVFISVTLAYFFRGQAFVVYVEPVASILIAIFIIVLAGIRIRDYMRDLAYVTLEEKDQMKIMTVLAHHFHDFERFFSVNSRKSGETVYIDFLVSFPEATTYGEIVGALKAMTAELEETFPDCKVSIVFDSKNALIEEK